MDFVINLDAEISVPLHKQLYEELRRAILSGRLTPGRRIPSTRAIADLLGISRTTAMQSYEALLSEGYLQAVAGSGTFVNNRLPEELLRAPQEKAIFKTAAPKSKQVKLSSFGKRLAAAFKAPKRGKETSISFRHGHPDFDALPLREWGRLLSRYCRTGRQAVFDYAGDPLGYKPLREAIAIYLARSRAVRCNADRVIIVNGSQQALDLVARVLIDSGDAVAMEDPGYLGAVQNFQAQGAKIFSVPVDDEGIEVDRLSSSRRKIKLVYVTPSHQFPTGAVLPLRRRLELLSWASRAGAIIIEDDYDSEYRYEGRPMSSLQGLDQDDSVVYVGTFSKVLFPSLRIAYIVVPKSLANAISQAKQLTDRQSPMLEQCALSDFINEGGLERHLRRMRTLYGARRRTLVETLKERFGERAAIFGESAGMHLLVRLNVGKSDEEIVKSAESAGVELISARQYFFKAKYNGEFVFGYAGLNERKIKEGVKRLSECGL